MGNTAEPKENNLTRDEPSGIILSTHERRIILNLRRLGKMYPDSEVAVLFKYYKGDMQYGTACHRDITERI